MTELISKQAELLRSISRASDNFKKYGKNNYTAARIRSRITSLKETWRQCVDGHASISSRIPEKERPAHQYFQQNQLEVYEDHYQVALDLMNEWLEELEPVVSPQNSSSTSDHTNSRANIASNLALGHLPPIKLPPFSGDFREWESFRDRFTALIISNQELSDVSRMHFLATSLTGSAQNIISRFPITAGNFKPAWSALLNRYENKRRLIETHVSALYNLPNMSRESASELHSLRDQAERSISALRTLGRSDAEVLSDIVVYFIAHKLDLSTKRAWKLKCSTESNPPHYHDLIKFISARALALEEIAPTLSKVRSVKTNNATTSSPSGPTCLFCRGAHRLSKCERFLNKSPIERRDVVKQKKLCFNCLHPSHTLDACMSKFTCFKCRQQHHSLLHVDSSPGSSSYVSASAQQTARANHAAKTNKGHDSVESEPSAKAFAMSSVTAASRPVPVLLATAKVIVESPNGRRQAVRALVDQGSEVTFISENLAQILRLPRSRTSTKISAVGGSIAGTCRHRSNISIYPRENDRPRFNTSAFILPELTEYQPQTTQMSSKWTHLHDLALADDEPTGSARIELLIGADLYGSIILSGVIKGRPSQPVAQNSHFGWLISGPTAPSGNPSPTIHAMHCALETELQRFWEVEELPTQQFLTPEEIQCEGHFAQTHTRNDSGRYVVRLPFRQGPPIEIGNSRVSAIQCLKSLDNRLAKNPEVKAEYHKFLTEYEKLGHMEPVPRPTPSDSQIVYIPHHAVIRESSTTTRLRVVFNASSTTTNGRSLNSYLLPGPKLQTELIEILLRWRQYAVVYTSDITKMYRQILVNERDRDYQRIVWHDKEGEPQDFRLNTVTYGTASAPFLALRVLQQLVRDEGAAYPIATTILRDNIYVDDVLFGADDEAHLRHAKQQVCALLNRGGFELRKWASNKAELLADISPENHGLAGNKLFSRDETLNILGVSWNPMIDAFHFHVELSAPAPATKRGVLSAIAKLYDPLGWVTPVTVKTKIFMQQLWLLKVDWDDNLPLATLKQWQRMYDDLTYLNQIQISRWTGYRSAHPQCEIHGFADASTVAYAAAVYMRTVSATHSVTIQLLVAKSRVAPLKTISVPRLELAAAALLARLVEFVITTLNLQTAPLHCWTDSTVVLAWLQSPPSRWKQFVANRVADVQTRTPRAIWRYVATHENPADIASRGLLGSELKSHPLWWVGPPWLSRKKTEWPSPPSAVATDVTDEQRVPTAHTVQPQEQWELATRYSHWSKLIRVTAYIHRFVTRIRDRKGHNSAASIPTSAALTANEYRESENFWIRDIQRATFAHVILDLKLGRAHAAAKSSLHALNPFLDHEGTLRVGGRIHNAALPFESKHPAILANHPLVDLLVRHTHVKLCHAGLQLTLSTLRQHLWILRGRTITKRIIHQCIPCVRQRAAFRTQLMGQLPPARVLNPKRAFEHCGLDYAGPVALRTTPGRGYKSQKGYIALFVCLASRAIHLEVVSNYSTPAFLDAFARFCSRRGLPGTVYSDNGTTFVGADRDMTRAYRAALTDPNFVNKTVEDHVEWKFIPPNAPHFGGLWEAGVRSVKHHLRRVLGTQTLTFEELTTLLCQIEACLNSRPLSALRDDTEIIEPLTPGHFLVGTALNLPPQPSLLNINENRLSRWQLIRHTTEKFWRLWQSDYVNTLQQRSKWREPQPNITVGTVVLIKNPLLPPCKWELGRVTQCHTGSDGLTRVVTVRTATSEYKRPIVKLCILPINNDDNEPKNCTPNNQLASNNMNAP